MTRPSVVTLGRFTEFEIEEVEQSIPARFERQVALGGERVAVKTPRSEVTYSELAEHAHRIACALLERSGPGEEGVGVLLGHGPNTAAAILGVLGAGKFYVPLDPSYPPARLRGMLAAADVRLLLADVDTVGRARSLMEDRRAVLDVGDLATESGGPPGVQLSPDAVAYIFFTSGTTGEPKGVFDSHRNVLHNILRYTNALRVSPSDRLTLLQSCAYSGSVSSLFGALLNGASSYPVSVSEEGATRIADWLREERVTMFHGVPAIFRSLLEPGRGFPDMRVVRLEGDRASSLDVGLFKTHFTRGAVLANGLGTTETGLCRQLLVDHDSAVPDGILPVGYPVRDMNVVLSDGQGELVGAGEVGEISVRSAYLALGYWGRPDLTEAAFRGAPGSDPERVYRTGDLGRFRADGCLEYLSRKNFQLKVRGHSVEPAEIESALLRIPGVGEAVAETVETTRGDSRLVAYVVPDGALPQPAQLRTMLAETLPNHLVPTVFVELDELPLGENGKVDRRALPEPSARRPIAGRPPRTRLERTLVAIWEDVLDVTPVRIDESFLDLGGDSLAAAILVARVEAETGRRLTPSMLLESSTVAQLAEALGREPESRSDVLVGIRPGGTRTPLFCVHGHNGSVLPFAPLPRRLHGDQPVYGLQAPGLWDPGAQPGSIEATAAYYLDAVRTVQSHGPYLLAGLCFGAIVAFEMAQQLVANNEEVALLALIGIAPPEFPGLVSPSARGRYERLMRGGGATAATRQAVRLSRELPPLRRVLYLVRRGTRLPWYVWRQLRREYARSPVDRRRRVVERSNRHATDAYAAHPYPGRVLLFLTEETTSLYSEDPPADWARLARGGVEALILPGNGRDLHGERLVDEVGRHLASLIVHGVGDESSARAAASAGRLVAEEGLVEHPRFVHRDDEE